MKSQNILFFLSTSIVCLAATMSSAQTINGVFKSTLYEYEGKQYKYNDMDSIFNQNAQAYEQFNKAKRRSKISRAMGLSAGGIIGLGIILIRTDKPTRSSLLGNLPGDRGYAGLALVTIGIPLGLTAIIVGNTKAKRKSIELFNLAYGFSPPNQKDKAPQLNVVSNNGLGLRLTF